MKDEDLTNPPEVFRSRESSMRDPEMLIEDQELKSLLAQWITPDVSASLNQRVLATFRKQLETTPVSDTTVSISLPGLTLLSTEEVMNMKECRTCQEEFASKFTFCPIDGTPLSDKVLALDDEPVVTVTDQTSSTFSFVLSDAYHLTIIEDNGLVRRLFTELSEAGRQSRLTWPEFKHDPIGFTRRSTRAYSAMAWRFFSAPNVAIACLAAILFMMTAVIGLVWLDRSRAESLAMRDKQREDLEFQGMVDIPDQQEEPEKGTAGAAKGKGGGSEKEQKKPGGGGGGGREDQRPASQGKLPPASLDIPQVRAPDPNPPPIKNPSLPVIASIDADPTLFPPDPRPGPYGDPKSKSTELSSGSGTGNGIGDGTGGGVGSGEGSGVGPGRGGNTGGGDRSPGGGGPGGGGGGTDYERTFKSNEVTQKARILSKPSPEYTEEARKNQVIGTVTLQMVFSSSGGVTNIRTISGLPFGLTEKAIAAARKIQFSPAMKDGRPVSQYIRVEYNFHIY